MKQKRDKMLKVMLTENESEILKNKAKKCNITVSKYIRYLFLNGKEIQPKEIENHTVEEKIGSLEKQLEKIETTIRKVKQTDKETEKKLIELLTSIDKRIELIEDTLIEVYKWD